MNAKQWYQRRYMGRSRTDDGRRGHGRSCSRRHYESSRSGCGSSGSANRRTSAKSKSFPRSYAALQIGNEALGLQIATIPKHYQSTTIPLVMGATNLNKVAIAFLAPLPSIFFYLSFLHRQQSNADSLSPLWTWCLHHPLLLANALFFFNVNVLFWIIGHLQSSHWMIDLYWTVIPVMLAHFYATHPLAHYNLWRSRIVILMTWVWSIRLTHNYFRRENWQWGAREDWRFSDLRRQYGKHWGWVSFFAVYLSQQLFLIGVCLPLYVVHSVDKPLGICDFVALAVCGCGIVVAYYADTQLHDFVSRNNKRKELGEPVVPNFDRGLWRYSRHPNYFGEQLWWWGLVVFAWNLGQEWTFVGSLVNSMCLAYVTLLVEERMLKQDYRAEAYRQYQKTTSIWIPWFKSSPSGGKDKNT